MLISSILKGKGSWWIKEGLILAPVVIRGQKGADLSPREQAWMVREAGAMDGHCQARSFVKGARTDWVNGAGQSRKV